MRGSPPDMVLKRLVQRTDYPEAVGRGADGEGLKKALNRPSIFFKKHLTDGTDSGIIVLLNKVKGTKQNGLQRRRQNRTRTPQRHGG